MKIYIYIVILFTLFFIFSSCTTKKKEITEEDIKENVTEFIQAINRANNSNEALNWEKVRITPEAIREVEELWNVCSFTWLGSGIKTRLLFFHSFWHARNIPIRMQPAGDRQQEFTERQLAIKMDNTGLILSVCISISFTEFEWCQSRIWPEDANDGDNRMQIINYVEYLYTAFHRNDIGFIKDFFGFDAITMEKSRDLYIFLTKVTNAFLQKQWINMYADNFLISRLRSQEDINDYSVRFTIYCQTSQWKEVGEVNMVWNFENPQRPSINYLRWVSQKSDKNKSDEENIHIKGGLSD